MLKKTINRMVLGVLLSGALLGSSTQMNAMGNWGKALVAGCVVAVGYWMWKAISTDVARDAAAWIVGMMKQYDAKAYEQRAKSYIEKGHCPVEYQTAFLAVTKMEQFKAFGIRFKYKGNLDDKSETVDVIYNGIIYRITHTLGTKDFKIARQQ
jgi:hypothetical protein